IACSSGFSSRSLPSFFFGLSKGSNCDGRCGPAFGNLYPASSRTSLRRTVLRVSSPALNEHGPAMSMRMLVCHCNHITAKEIDETIISLLDEDPWQLIVPAKVYHRLKQRGRCCGCFPNVVETIIRVTEDYHLRNGAGETEIVPFLDRV